MFTLSQGERTLLHLTMGKVAKTLGTYFKTAPPGFIPTDVFYCSTSIISS
jgi:hypothetical protein